MTLRVVYTLRMLPLRIAWLAKHFYKGGNGLLVKKSQADVRWWWAELTFRLLDLVFVPEVYESLMDFAKWNSRPLTEREKQLARSVFGQAIDLDRVRVDEKARVACRERNIIYVSFYTINAWGRLRPDVFIHELVHVWQ